MTLRYLVDAGQTDLGEIADQVAAWEHDTTIDELPAKQRKRVYISLYQSHLPTLAEHGVVEYDQDSNRVTPTRTLSRFEPYLDVASEDRSADRSSSWQHGPVLTASLLTALGVLVVVQLVGSETMLLALPLVLVGLVGVTAATSVGLLA